MAPGRLYSDHHFDNARGGNQRRGEDGVVRRKEVERREERKEEDEQPRGDNRRRSWPERRTSVNDENAAPLNRGGGCWDEHKDEEIDSDEEYRRSRSRERKRRKTQYQTMQRNRRGSTAEASQVFWDGFQWVKKGEGLHEYDQEMNSTRRARRLHIGNLPVSRDAQEEEFRTHMWAAMLANQLCDGAAASPCPILHVWFARDRGGSFGFIEMASVGAAHAALTLDGFSWKGSSIRINRPTDWKSTSEDKTIEALASASGLSLDVAESLAAAAQQARNTGNTGGLMKLVSSLPEGGQTIITDLLNSQAASAAVAPLNRAVDLLTEKIRADLLVGAPSRVIRIEKPSEKANTEKELEEVLDDIRDECSKEGTLVAAFIVSPSNKDKLTADVDIGDAFIEFAQSNTADNCIINISGRVFEGKPVKAQRYDETVWKNEMSAHSQNLLLQTLRLRASG
eukprot:GHVS01074649.1.p1 GENE.GHVS01074649.1~~GHVS01074649.1.p1  ORF type:complete len:453 (+),score=77.34 GHVS01074649.1:147-1505(+)